MAAGEDQPQQVVADIVVREALGVVALHVGSVQRQFDAEFILLARVQLALADVVDAAVPSRGHQPGGRVVRHALARPALQRGEEYVLRQFLGSVDVAGDACQPRQQLWRFHPPQGIEAAMEVIGFHPADDTIASPRHASTRSLGRHLRHVHMEHAPLVAVEVDEGP